MVENNVASSPPFVMETRLTRILPRDKKKKAGK